MYKFLIRPILFCFDPEKVHHFTFTLIRFVNKIPFIPNLIRSLYVVNDKRLERNLFGLTFKNPVGLAAGFDKDAKLFNKLSNFGFGFIEIGTLTPKPQEGNPKKRLFRLKADQAIINRMGFNNGGVAEAVESLKKNFLSGCADIIVGNPPYKKLTKNKQLLDKYKAELYNTNTNNLFSFSPGVLLRLGGVVFSSKDIARGRANRSKFTKGRSLLH